MDKNLDYFPGNVQGSVVTKSEEIRLPDGRISPHKAIKLVRKLMDEMSNEEFLRLATQPIVLKVPGGQPSEEKSQD